jgi:hypothetical protein
MLFSAIITVCLIKFNIINKKDMYIQSDISEIHIAGLTCKVINVLRMKLLDLLHFSCHSRECGNLSVETTQIPAFRCASAGMTGQLRNSSIVLPTGRNTSLVFRKGDHYYG